MITIKNYIIPINQAFNSANILFLWCKAFVCPVKFLFLCEDFQHQPTVSPNHNSNQKSQIYEC